MNQSALREDDTFDDTDHLLVWDGEEAPERTAEDSKESRRERPELKTRAWAKGRFLLGIIQMIGAVVSVFLLVQTGVSILALSAVVLTCVCTTVSVLLFGSHRRGGKREPR